MRCRAGARRRGSSGWTFPRTEDRKSRTRTQGTYQPSTTMTPVRASAMTTAATRCTAIPRSTRPRSRGKRRASQKMARVVNAQRAASSRPGRRATTQGICRPPSADWMLLWLATSNPKTAQAAKMIAVSSQSRRFRCSALRTSRHHVTPACRTPRGRGRSSAPAVRTCESWVRSRRRGFPIVR